MEQWSLSDYDYCQKRRRLFWRHCHRWPSNHWGSMSEADWIRQWNSNQWKSFIPPRARKLHLYIHYLDHILDHGSWLLIKTILDTGYHLKERFPNVLFNKSVCSSNVYIWRVIYHQSFVSDNSGEVNLTFVLCILS